VLFVLDADQWFGTASDITAYLTMVKEGPPMVVVGISYGGTEDDWWRKRARDYTPKLLHSEKSAKYPLAGGADQFQQFLTTELFPFIEANYAVLPNDRTLVGLSFGGLFGVYTLFTRPEMFQGYIILASGLGWDKEQILETEAAFRAKHSALQASVYFAVGDKDTPGTVTKWQAFDRLISERRYEGLRWTSRIFPDETHISVYPGALTRGLKTIHPPAAPAAPAAAPVLTAEAGARAALSAYIVDFWTKRDPIALGRAFSPKMIYHYNGETVPGTPKDHLAGLREFGGAFPDLVGTIDRFTFSDGIGAAVTSWTGTHLGELAGIGATGMKPIPPTGRKVSWTVNYVFRVENGKIVELWEAWDEANIYLKLCQPDAKPAP
jgi:predicted alpha/beta superfamily hydrolase/predicted ester cyclase